jgi:hypothetical protein
MHQELVTDVESKIKSMGLVIKPKKCRSLSILKGKPVNIPFQLKDKETGDNIVIASVIDKPMKFLGSEVTENNTLSAMFAFLYSKLKQKLENIDKSTLRGEHKSAIYSRYALPSIRFYFSVHQIHKTHEEKLDALARLYLKKWLGIQKHGVTDAAIFHPYMLGLKAPSHIYKEAHAGNHAMVRTKGDIIVNHALGSRIKREEAWTRKKSTAVEMQTLWEKYQDKNKITQTPDTEAPTNNSKSVQHVKKFMRDEVKKQTICDWNSRVKKLTFQGDFIKLQIDEKENVLWKSFITNIPKGVLSFTLKACSNGLNTPDNLKRWGVKKTNKCDLCGNPSSLKHILNWCPKALKEGRFTWRHNSVLSHFITSLKKNAPENLELFADLPNFWLNGGTIPPDILPTGLRPDLVIINRIERKIDLLELTCSYETNLEKANIRKAKNYNDLKTDLEKAGWKVTLVPFEIGSRGLVNKRNRESLTSAMKRNNIKIRHTQLFKELSKISLLCSYSIFQAHCVPSWQDPPFLHP